MAVVFLDAINKTLKRIGSIQGDAQELSTSTVSTATGFEPPNPFDDSQRQHQVDLVIQGWQEAVHEIYDLGLLPNEAASATIALVTDQREYDLPSNFEKMAGADYDQRVWRGATRTWRLTEYRGGYAQMLSDQMLPTLFLGDPLQWAISPVDGLMVRIDRNPTSIQNGQTYNALYEKRVALTATMATATMSFSDSVVDNLVPVVGEFAHRQLNSEFDPALFRTSLARAVSFVTKNQPKLRYGQRPAMRQFRRHGH